MSVVGRQDAHFYIGLARSVINSFGCWNPSLLTSKSASALLEKPTNDHIVLSRVARYDCSARKPSSKGTSRLWCFKGSIQPESGFRIGSKIQAYITDVSDLRALVGSWNYRVLSRFDKVPLMFETHGCYNTRRCTGGYRARNAGAVCTIMYS